jgi:predicted amidophosphoribosyltransferase
MPMRVCLSCAQKHNEEKVFCDNCDAKVVRKDRLDHDGGKVCPECFERLNFVICFISKERIHVDEAVEHHGEMVKKKYAS